MMTEADFLKWAIRVVDSTRIISTNNVDSLIKTAKYVITRAMQRDTKNTQFLTIYYNILDIELSRKKSTELETSGNRTRGAKVVQEC